MIDFKQAIEQWNALLPVGTSVSYTEAERRAGEFLYAMALIVTRKYELSSEKILALSTQTAVYAQEMAKGTSSTMTANKITAEASPEYIQVRETLEHIENDISYLKAYYDIYNNAHIFFRNLAKGVNE